MNSADIAILAVLALSTLFGLMRGFVREVLSLVCWLAAFWVAWAFGDRIAQLYGGWLHEPTARLLAGYATCFLGVLIVGALVGWVLRKLMDVSGLRGGDRFLWAERLDVSEQPARRRAISARAADGSPGRCPGGPHRRWRPPPGA